MRALYNILYGLGFVLLSPAFLYKMWKRGKYRENFWQRFGAYRPELRARLQKKTGPRCWIQAVSVGEINLTLTLIPEWRRQLPDMQIVVTTTTSTGYALARERLPAEVTLLYFPQDFLWCVRRAYNLIQPDCVVLVESEIWPNQIWEAAQRNVPVFLVNARMSPRSARRHHRGVWFFRHVWEKFSLVCAQSRDDADNYRALRLPRVELTGNIKYDASLPQAGKLTVDPGAVLRALGVEPARPILVAGSTWPGEEEILFDLLPELRAKVPGLFLVLVPRHVERTPEIVELAKRKNAKVALRKGGDAVSEPDCLLVNTTGELKAFYQAATVIFVGKSLAGNVGGQNIVEAAASGHPVVFGAQMQNFRQIAAEFVAAGAGVQVQDGAELQRALRDLLLSEALRQQVAAAAGRVIAANVGATARTVKLIAHALNKPVVLQSEDED
jgi:3-deoxy-D-manno-octulosonic-acid transferase